MYAIVVAAALGTVPGAGLQIAPAPPQQADSEMSQALDAALALAGLTRDSARFDENILRFYRFDEFTLPSFDALQEAPYRAPFFMGLLRAQIGANVGKPNELLMLTRGWTGDAVRRTLLGDPTAAWQAEAREDNALQKVLASTGSTAAPPKGVPVGTLQAAALILIALRESKVYRDLAFRAVQDLNEGFRTMGSSDDGPRATMNRLDLMRKADLRYLLAGAHDVLLATQVAAVWAANVSPEIPYDVELRAPWGSIRLRGAGNHTTRAGDSLLIIDTGGADTYLGGGYNSSSANWASIVLDTAGDDKYLAAPEMAAATVAQWEGRKRARRVPAHGGALFGYAVLIDTAGNDLYRSDRPAQGSGRFGVGVLLDAAGDDTYDSYVDAQGFGQFGVGILADTVGSDTYLGFNQVQGCGLTRGVGMLADSTGDDRYAANDSAIDFPSPQTSEHNVTMGQGAGYGLRSDYSDGHSLGGGLGVLYDGAGFDRYSCGVFGQGVGYWQGIGALLDGGGNDEYSGVWYTQGASAHFAVGYLEDTGGSDKYTATMNMAQGAGHDFSVGYLLDRDGNDRYAAPNLSLGAGNANGIGVFVDFRGDDFYESKGATFGKANAADPGSPREIALCLGLFLDLGGSDTFPPDASWAKNGAQIVNWTRRGGEPRESQLGIFFDKP